MEIVVNAVMLRSVDYNENDKILTLLTAERGKITAGIKGVKKAAAKLKFAAQPFCFAEYVLASRGDKYTVINASESESFYDLRTDINKFYAASAACEAANALTFEGDECREIFYELVKALSEMCSDDECLALIRFLLFALKQSGYGISADKCISCGADLVGEDRLRFDMDAGAFTCADCGTGLGASRVTYNVLRKISGKPYEEDFITPDGQKRALRLIREYFAYKQNASFKSLSEYIRLL
ncbi:MAG: DNA repair protein RecO [Clostridia bacterium]|nr:DNA repair protein RecO [Clostridia bacterium]